MANVPIPAKPLEIKIAMVVNDYTLVINRGRENGITVGQRLLVYTIGDDVIDPDTKESLGKLEVVKGTGRITHLQDKIATLSSDMKSPPGRSIRKVGSDSSHAWSALTMLGQATEIEEQLPPEPIPFKSPSPGDLVKKI
jgi:hypothetical protein